MNKYTFIIGIVITLLGVIFGVYYALLQSFATGSLIKTYEFYVDITYIAMFVGTVFIILGLFMNWNTKQVELLKPVKMVLTKPTLVLMIMVVNGLSTYSGSLVNYFIHNQSMAVATSVFLGVVFNALVTYFTTEEQTAPEIKTKIPPVEPVIIPNPLTNTEINYNVNYSSTNSSN